MVQLRLKLMTDNVYHLMYCGPLIEPLMMEWMTGFLWLKVQRALKFYNWVVIMSLYLNIGAHIELSYQSK